MIFRLPEYLPERGVLPPHPRCARGDGEWSAKCPYTQRQPENHILSENHPFHIKKTLHLTSKGLKHQFPLKPH